MADRDHADFAIVEPLVLLVVGTTSKNLDGRCEVQASFGKCTVTLVGIEAQTPALMYPHKCGNSSHSSMHKIMHEA